MKKILLTGVLACVTIATAGACSCADEGYTPTERYHQSDFIATVKITASADVPTTPGRRAYTITIQPLKIFKGTAPEKLRVQGVRFGARIKGSCELSLQEGQEWLIAIRVSPAGYHALNKCSYARKLTTADGADTRTIEDRKALKQFLTLRNKSNAASGGSVLNKRV